MRQDHQQFLERDTVILVIGTENTPGFRDYWHKHKLLFTGLSDEKKTVLKSYGQENKTLKLGRQPAQIIIDKEGIIRYLHYGNSMSDIPGNEVILELLDQLQA